MLFFSHFDLFFFIDIVMSGLNWPPPPSHSVFQCQHLPSTSPFARQYQQMLSTGSFSTVSRAVAKLWSWCKNSCLEHPHKRCPHVSWVSCASKNWQIYHSCYNAYPFNVALNLTWKGNVKSHSAHWWCNLSALFTKYSRVWTFESEKITHPQKKIFCFLLVWCFTPL